MMRLSNLLRFACVLGLSCLGACATSGVSNGPEASFNIGERFPISVEPRMITMRLPYEGPQSLNANAEAQISRFATDYLDHGSGMLGVTAPRQFGEATAEVRNRLEKLGVPEDRIMIGTDGEPGPGGGLRLTYIRYMAQSPSCGDWTENLGRTFENVTPPNFGCSTQHNIAAMVADPRDLLAPRQATPADAARRLEVLAKYRKGEPTVAKKAEEQSGVVTEVGKNK